MMTSCRRIGDGVFVLILALTLWGCNKVSPEMKPYVLQGASHIQETAEADGARTIAYNVKLYLPGDEQLKGIANSSEWTPLKSDAILPTSSSMKELNSTFSTEENGSLFTWSEAYAVPWTNTPVDLQANQRRNAWCGEWRNKQGDLLTINAAYNPKEVKSNKVQSSIRVMLLSPAALRIIQESFLNHIKSHEPSSNSSNPSHN